MSHGNAALSVVGDGVVEGEELSLALRGLVLLAQFHRIAADGGQLAHKCAFDNARDDDTMVVLLARRLGLKAKIGRRARSIDDTTRGGVGCRAAAGSPFQRSAAWDQRGIDLGTGISRKTSTHRSPA